MDWRFLAQRHAGQSGVVYAPFLHLHHTYDPAAHHNGIKEKEMKCVYEVTTKYSTSVKIYRDVTKFVLVAKNMKEALSKTEAHLKKIHAGAERPDEVRLIAELDF